jgi:hypothetical protein
MAPPEGSPGGRGPAKRVFVLLLVIFSLLQGLSFPVWGEPPHSLSTEHFALFFSPSDRRLAEHLSGLAEGIYGEIVADVGVEPRPGIEIYIEATHKAFLDRQPNPIKAPEWAAGLAYPELNIMILKAPRAALYGTIDPLNTFRHELAHLTLHQALAGIAIPKWFDEGFSMYAAREWSLRTTAVISAVTLRKRYIPMASLNQAFPIAYEEAEVAYAQSFSLVAYLLNHFGRNSFHQFVRNLKSGMTLSQSTQQAFGLSFYEIEKKWHRHLRIRYTWIPVITSSVTLWFLMSLIFFFVYLKKKRQAREIVVEWELEDMWEDS